MPSSEILARPLVRRLGLLVLRRGSLLAFLLILAVFAVSAPNFLRDRKSVV